MRGIDEDALICDFAQYYSVFDIDLLELGMAATLACGLPEDSRIMKAVNGNRPDGEKVHRLAVLDALRSIEFALWQTHSKKKLQRPESLLEKLLNTGREKEKELKGVNSAEEFEKVRTRIIQGTQA